MSHTISQSVRDRTVAEIAPLFGVGPRDVLSQSRRLKVAHARQAAFAALRAMKDAEGRPRYSLPAIGRAFDRDHTTVLHGLKAHANRQTSALPFKGGE